jgi:hypothetical protein
MRSESSLSKVETAEFKPSRAHKGGTYGAQSCTTVLQQGVIRTPESDIVRFNRTFHIHNLKSMLKISKNNPHHYHALRSNSHKLHNRVEPTNEQAYCRSPNQAVTNQRAIIVIKGEISSVECCLWSERTSLGTSDLESSA